MQAYISSVSPSSRRAWIEIVILTRVRKEVFVALLAEGVDRNQLFRTPFKTEKPSPSSRRAWIEITIAGSYTKVNSMSPSSRRAWIEISGCQLLPKMRQVALLAEGVDRNGGARTPPRG